MKRKLFVAAWVVLGLGVAAIYNNCGEVAFKNPTGDEQTTASTETGAPSGGGTDNTEVGTAPPISNTEIINANPGIISEPVIPITEYVNLTPEQLNKFRVCGTSTEILICHFPQNFEDRKPLCVGESSVPSHYDHIRQYTTTDGKVVEYFDYLGPCR